MMSEPIQAWTIEDTDSPAGTALGWGEPPTLRSTRQYRHSGQLHRVILAAISACLIVSDAAFAQAERTRGIVAYDGVRVDVIAEGGGPLVILLPSRGRDSEARRDCCRNCQSRLPRVLKYLRTAFFAPSNNATVWLKGWHPDVDEIQFAAGRATKQSEWWAGGNIPMLDLQGANDPFKPRAMMNELREEFGERATIVVILNASHALIPEQPAAVTEANVAWIRKLPHQS